MAIHNNVNELLDDVKAAYLEGKAACAKAGYEIFELETYREYLVQCAYFSRSRAPVRDVQFAYAQAGLYKPSPDECRSRITNALFSKHIERKAIDIGVKLGGVRINPTLAQWKGIGAIFQSYGFRWGGDWNGDGKTRSDGDLSEELVDLPHIEWKL